MRKVQVTLKGRGYLIIFKLPLLHLSVER